MSMFTDPPGAPGALSVDDLFEISANRINRAMRVYVRRWYGERCKDYEPECPCCKAWHAVDIIRTLAE